MSGPPIFAFHPRIGGVEDAGVRRLQDDIIPETSGLMGFKRMGAKLDAITGGVLTSLIDAGEVRAGVLGVELVGDESRENAARALALVFQTDHERPAQMALAAPPPHRPRPMTCILAIARSGAR